MPLRRRGLIGPGIHLVRKHCSRGRSTYPIETPPAFLEVGLAETIEGSGESEWSVGRLGLQPDLDYILGSA